MGTDTLIEKGITLLREALKQYEDSKFEAAAHTRKAANEVLDEVDSQMNSQEGKDDMLYGENRNFGIIFNVLSENVKNYYAQNRLSGEQLKEVYSTIQNDPILKEEFNLYNALEFPKEKSDAERYVNEAIGVVKHFSPKKIKEANMKLVDIMRKHGMNESINIDLDDLGLYVDAEYVFMHKPSYSNLSEYANIRKSLTENVEARMKKITEAKENLEEALNTISEKYGKELNDTEMALVKEIAEAKDKSALFTEKKANLLRELDEAAINAEENDRAVISEIVSKIQDKVFDKENPVMSIFEMEQYKEALK